MRSPFLRYFVFQNTLFWFYLIVFLAIYISTLREKCPYSELFWSAFPRIRTEYGDTHLSVFSSNTEKCGPENSECGQFSRNATCFISQLIKGFEQIYCILHYFVAVQAAIVDIPSWIERSWDWCKS